MKAIIRREVEEINAVNEKRSDETESVKNQTEPCLDVKADSILKGDSNVNRLGSNKNDGALDSTLTDTEILPDVSDDTHATEETPDLNENTNDRTLILQEKDEELHSKQEENLSNKDSANVEASIAAESVQQSKSITREDSKDSPKTDSKSKHELKISESQASLLEQDNRPDNQTVLRLLDDGEKIR